jgi:hypothetical protein
MNLTFLTYMVREMNRECITESSGFQKSEGDVPQLNVGRDEGKN